MPAMCGHNPLVSLFLGLGGFFSGLFGFARMGCLALLLGFFGLDGRLGGGMGSGYGFSSRCGDWSSRCYRGSSLGHGQRSEGGGNGGGDDFFHVGSRM